MASVREPSSAASSAPWKGLACILAIFLVASWLATCSTLWDRDEPRFAQAAVEMASSGQLLYPTFNGELRPDKPILIYWLMALSVHAFGASAWAARAWAPLALAASAWLTWRIARRFLSPSAALLGGLVLASAPLALGEGTVATTDAVLLACTTSAMAVFAGIVERGARARDYVLLALALGAAQLVKGPVGLAVPLLSILASAWILRGQKRFSRGFGAGLVLAALGAVALFCAWAIPANLATGGEFAQRGLGHHVADRMLQPLEGHGGRYLLGLFFYVPVILLGIGPWILQLPAALVALAAGRLGNPALRGVLLGWIVAPFALMTLVATKLPHYVLPIFPALAIAVAAVIDAAVHGALAARDLAWMKRGAFLYAALLVLEVAALGVAALRPEAASLRVPILALAMVLGAGGCAAAWAQARGRWRSAATTLLAGALVLWLVVGGLVLPRVEELKLAPRLAQSIRAATPDTTPIATFVFDEPSLHFSSGRWPIEHLPNEAALDAWALERRDGVLVLPRPQADALARRLAERAPAELASVSGFNYSKGKPLELVALRRGQ